VSKNCEEFRDLIGPYVLGITDAEETRAIEQALADCPELQQELKDYAQITEALHYAVPLRYNAPPADDILTDLAGESSPAVPQTELKVVARPRRTYWWLGVAALLAITLISLAANFFSLNEIRALRQALNTPPSTPSQPFNVVLNAQQAHHRVLTPPTADGGQTLARVIWNSEIEVGSLFVTGLDSLPPDMAYQLWAVRAGEALSLGQFDVDETGTGFLIFQSPEPIASFDALGISPEPATGSAAPTHDHVVVGKI
jgi:anti-sigma-K factor RskA